MSSNSNWIDVGVVGKFTGMNDFVILDVSGVNRLASEQITPSFTELVVGSFTQWCSSLIYYPMKLIREGQQAGTLNVCGVSTDVPCYGSHPNLQFGFTLGEKYYTSFFNDFRDFEPYTTLQVYLPFYGYATIPIKEVIGKYIQFRLFIDWTTGQGLYVIGVSDHSITSPNKPLLVGTDDSDTRIVSKVVCNIGQIVPLGQTGMAEAIRNTSMGVLKTAVSAATIASASKTGSGGTTTTTTKTTVRNPKTGRQVTKGTSTETTESDVGSFYKTKAYASCFNSAVDAINSASIKPNVESTNSPFVEANCPKSIKVVITRAKFTPINTGEFDKIYGRPLGETRVLSTVHGYTEVAGIHFEGEGFAEATDNEKSLIEQEMSSGVILP